MKKNNLLLGTMLIAALGAILFVSCSGSDQKEGMDIYLLIGQSNMAGRGIMSASDTVSLKDVLLFNDSSRFEPARHPLNKYSSVRKELSLQGINLGYEFGKVIAETTGRKVGLVVNARGGTSIKEWQKNNLCYEEAIRRTREAMKYGDLKAVLWHQGSSDQKDPERYIIMLDSMITNMRHDLGNPDLPFVVGQLGHWRVSFTPFNEMITHVPDSIENTGWVSSEDLYHNPGDSLHFDAASLNILGKRYASKILEMVYGIENKLPGE